MHSSLNSRLKALENQAGPAGESTIVFLPEEDSPGDPDFKGSPKVRADWEEYRRTGKSASGVVIYPIDVEIHKPVPGTTIIVTQDETWYGNDAHERERERRREQVTAKSEEIADGPPPIVFDPNWHGNADLIRERMAERAATQADGTGLEQLPQPQKPDGGSADPS